MIPRRSLPGEALQLARRQASTLSVAQLAGFGITDRVVERMVAQGVLSRITRGICATGEGGWSQLAWAGILIGGPSAVLGLRAAAFLQGLVTEPPAEIAVFSGTQVRQRDGRWRFIRSTRSGSGEPPRTRPTQTVLDLVAEVSADEAVSLLAEAIGRRGVRPREVLQLLEHTSRHPHRRLLSELVLDVAAGAQSPLEVRYVRDVERAHRLPQARRQASPVGRGRCDGWYEQYDVLVELDGRAYHSGVSALADMDRDAEHLLAGLVTLRFGWRHVVGDPCRVAAQVAGVLQRRGWSGTLRRCPRCKPRIV